MSEYNYPATIQPLSEEDGSGYVVIFPDLPGCMADGATPEEAFKQAQDAMIAWIKTAKEFGDPIPKPSTLNKYSGQWRMRAPKSLHAALASRAKEEGVSLNTLVITLLSQGLSKGSH